MKSFRWHGIPVNLPSTKTGWILLSAFIGVEAIILIVLAIRLAIR
jgi:hypothetical protein